LLLNITLVVEDAAQSHGAMAIKKTKSKIKKKSSVAAWFYLEIWGIGDGGAITTNDSAA
jgi:dTDP-4-amino-4,6-dideoxygalactose transaminase